MQSADKFDVVIFDWDGTLFNSIEQIVASLLYAADYHQQPITYDEAKNIIGLGLPEAMHQLFPQVPHLHQQISKTYGQHYVAHSDQNSWFEGIPQLLDLLTSQGREIAVATGKSRIGLDRMLKQTNSAHRFTATRTADETRSKPDPLMLNEIVQATSGSISRTVMIGDTSYDLDMAQQIAMPSIGVSYGVHQTDVLQQYQPIYIAHHVQELIKFFA